jgi:O-antigen/teichoic acid export membrane protein
VAQKSIKLNALMNTIRTISTMIFPLITFPYTSRILGPEGIGKVSFATSFVSYFILLASIGIPLYGIREIARVRDDKKKLNELTQELFVMQLISSVIISLIFIVLIFMNGKLSDEKILFFIVSFSIILTTMGMEWLYQGLEQYSYITIRSIIFSTISTIAIFIFIHSKQDYIISAAIGVIAALGSSVLNFYNARKILFAKRTEPWNFKRHIKPLAIVYLMNFIISIYIQLDTVMLGFMSSAKNVGYYASGLKINKMLLALVTSLGSVLLPRLSYYIANDMKDEFHKMLKKSFEVIWILCLPIVAALMLLSKEIIVLFAGYQYLPASICIIVTAPIILFIGLTNIIGIQILYPLGRDKEVVYSVAAGAIVAIILNLFLIPYLAYIGAAIAILTSELVVLIVQIILISKEYRVLMPYNTIRKYLIATLIMVVLIVLIKIEISQYWLRLLIAVPSGVLLYFGMLLLMKEPLVLEIIIKVKEKIKYV